MSFIINSYRYSSGAGEALLLDDYSGAECAYSVRLLKSDYSGALVKIRRSSDSAEKDFYPDSNNELTTSSEDGAGTSLSSWISTDSGYVVTWYDQSGNSADATMATAAKQPRIVNAGTIDTVNGKTAILGDGTDDSLRYSGFTFSDPITNFMVYDKVGGAGALYFGLFTAAPSLALAYDFQTTGIRAYRGTGVLTPDFGTNDQMLVSFMGGSTGTDWDIYVDGSQVTNSGEDIGTLVPTQVSLFDRPNNQSRCNGYMQEYIVYDSDQFSNRSGIETNINDYYSIY